MAEAGAFLVPTLATYDAMERRGGEINMAAVSRQKNSEVLDAGRTAIERARAAGVCVGFGTDLMGPWRTSSSTACACRWRWTGSSPRSARPPPSTPT